METRMNVINMITIMFGRCARRVERDELQYYFVYLSLFSQKCGIRTAVLALGY